MAILPCDLQAGDAVVLDDPEFWPDPPRLVVDHIEPKDGLVFVYWSPNPSAITLSCFDSNRPIRDCQRRVVAPRI